MPRFLTCFPSRASTALATDQGGEGLVQQEQEREPFNGSTSSSKINVRGRGCVFCDVSTERGFNVCYEDDKLIAFHDRTPRAKVHLLIIPREHIVSSVRDLTRDHIPLLRSMTALATTLVPPTSSLSNSPSTSTTISSAPAGAAAAASTTMTTTTPVKPPKMGFHIPPFSSVPHLHLHVFSGKHTFIGKFKYPISTTSSSPSSHSHSHGHRAKDRNEYTSGVRDKVGGGTATKKGLGWFVTPDQVEQILLDGGRVGLGRG
ncbi:hypothetical protein IAU59_004314 [Kwoniella sp. CBS 9459]